MRQVGTLINEKDAQRLADYLVTLGISTRVDSAADGYSIWVFDENEVERAKQTFDEFRANPTAPIYVAAEEPAQRLRRQEAESQRKAQKNVIELGQRWQGAGQRGTPLTTLMIIIAICLTAATNFGRNVEILRWLVISESVGGFQEIQQGQIWRLVTPIFLHFDAIHLLFDMYWLYLLGSLIEIRRGTWVLGALVLVSAVASNLGQYLYEHSPLFGGMSGVDYALLGYAWMKSRFDPRAGIFIHPSTVMWMVAWLLICMTGKVGDIANAAHLIGLLVGVAFGYLPIILSR